MRILAAALAVITLAAGALAQDEEQDPRIAIARLKRDNARLEARSDAMASALASLRDEVKQLGARVEQLDAQLQQQSARASRAIADAERIAAELQETKTRLAQAVKANDELHAACEKLRSEAATTRRTAPTGDEMAARRREREVRTMRFVVRLLARNVAELREELEGGKIEDAWGNPIVLLRSERYALPVEVTNAAGERVEVRARKRADGTFCNPDTFQILCLGPDGAPGTGDDITNFGAEEREGAR